MFKVAVNTETGKVIAVAGDGIEIKTNHLVVQVRNRADFEQRFWRSEEALRMLADAEYYAQAPATLPEGVVTLTGDEIDSVREKVEKAKTVKDAKKALASLVDAME